MRRQRPHSARMVVYLVLLAAVPSACTQITSAHFTRLTTRPGWVDGEHGGEALTTFGGTPSLKNGGYIVRQGGGPGSSEGYDSNQGGLWDGTLPPTDGGYERIYNSQAGFIAVKATGELACWGNSQHGIYGCPVAGCTRTTCTAAGVDAYYPKPISYIYSGHSAHCARACRACSKSLSLSPPLFRVPLAALS